MSSISPSVKSPPRSGLPFERGTRRADVPAELVQVEALDEAQPALKALGLLGREPEPLVVKTVGFDERLSRLWLGVGLGNLTGAVTLRARPDESMLAHALPPLH